MFMKKKFLKNPKIRTRKKLFMKAKYFYFIFLNIFKRAKEPLRNVNQPLKSIRAEKNLTRYTLPTEVSAHFCRIWWFLNVEHTEDAAELWKITKYDKNLAKNEEKPCSNILKPIFWLIPGSRKIGISGNPFPTNTISSLRKKILKPQEVLLTCFAIKMQRLLNNNKKVGHDFYLKYSWSRKVSFLQQQQTKTWLK